MGRVRRYKKFKACDPYSKRTKAEVDTVHDEPPDVFEEKEENDRKRKERQWDNPMRMERMWQREAMKELKLEEAKAAKKEKKIEGKKESESMKEFKQRLRQETRLTLREELKAMTSTAKKRKERLKMRSLKRKGKLSTEGGAMMGGDIREVEGEFNASETGHQRPSDLGGRASFETQEIVKFGERVDRPPVLSSFTSALVKKPKQQQLPVTTQQELVEDIVDEDLGEEEAARKKRSKRKRGSLDQMFEIDDSGSNMNNNNSRHIPTPNPTSSSTSTSSAAAPKGKDMEKLRLEMIAAYRSLRSKKMESAAAAKAPQHNRHTHR